MSRGFLSGGFLSRGVFVLIPKKIDQEIIEQYAEQRMVLLILKHHIVDAGPSLLPSFQISTFSFHICNKLIMLISTIETFYQSSIAVSISMKKNKQKISLK